MTGKVTIIGSGGVGSAIGYALNFIPSVNMIVFVDLNIRAADGEALDIGHGIGALSTASVRAGDYEDCRNSDVIIITAGFGRQVGETRDDLRERNQKVMDSVLSKLRPFYTDSFVIVVSNPVDYLTGYVSRQGFIPAEKLCGTGCMLDTSRWISELCRYLNVKCSRVHAYSVGKHGSGQRLLWPLVTVDGKPIDDFCREQGITWGRPHQSLAGGKGHGDGSGYHRQKGPHPVRHRHRGCLPGAAAAGGGNDPGLRHPHPAPLHRSGAAERPGLSGRRTYRLGGGRGAVSQRRVSVKRNLWPPCFLTGRRFSACLRFFQ
ncbi:MAG: hypothetical protein LUF86_02500 [Clostridiales bacterium]|nr:hypothetical protein [Clostridiales bacterium]